MSLEVVVRKLIGDNLMLFFVLSCSLLLIGGCSFGLYTYLTWHFDHWLKRKVPGPTPKVLFGTFPGTVCGTRNFIYDLDDVYRRYKKQARFIGVFMTRNPQLLVLDPEICRDILIGNFKCFQDNESSKWVKSMFPIIESIGVKLVRYLEDMVMIQGGQLTIDAKEISLCFTGEVVADVVWGIAAGNFDKDIQQGESTFLQMSKQMIAQTFKAFKYFFIIGIFPFIRHVIYVRFFPEVTDRFFLNLTSSTLQVRRSKPNNSRCDFLQYLLELQVKKRLDETQMLAHMLTFHFDGFETSATLISHCLLLLARCSKKQEKLRREIQDYMASHGNILDFSDLMKLPYLEQCIAETLRIFTPLPFMAKLCTKSCTLDNADGICHQIGVGDVCLISLHSLHHDEDYFPQPEEFIPERFADENGGTKKFKDMGVYLPFGAGPRICLGMTFGLVQAKAAIVKIIERFELTVNERTRKDNYQAANGFITGLDGGIFLNLKML